jgi:predicted DNA-binding transcriptional regulator AlpA
VKTASARNDWTLPRLIQAGGAAGEVQDGGSVTPQREAEDALLNVNEVAAFLRVSPETVKYLRSQGRFAPAIKIGRRVMWLHSDVVAWRDQQRERA